MAINAQSTPQNTGILSPEMRQVVVRQQSVNVSAIRSDLLGVERRNADNDARTANVIQEQTNLLGNFNANLQNLRDDISRLSAGIDGISQSISLRDQAEINRIKSEQELKRLEAEAATRSGRESSIESNINQSLLVPVQALTPKVQSTFDRIRQALGILLAGWLTDQLIEYIEAEQEGNTDKLEEIKDATLTNLGRTLAALRAVKTGFGSLASLISSTAKGLYNLFISRPLQGLRNAIRRPTSPNTRVPGANPGVKPSRTSGFFKDLFKNPVLVAQTIMNAQNGEIVDAAIAAAAILGPGKFVKTAAALAYSADEIAEALGLNLTGKDPNEQVGDRKNKNFLLQAFDMLLKLKEDGENKTNTQSNSNTQTPISAKEKTLPPPEFNTEISEPTSETNIPNVAIAEPQETITGDSIKSESTNAFPMVAQAQPMETITGEKTNQDPNSQSQDSIDAMTPDGAIEPLAQVSADNPSSLKISAMPGTPQKVGELPEAKPEVAIIKGSKSPQKSVSLASNSNGPLNPIPTIPSANTSNFYRRYSELSYQVIV